jgi:hypothetical protein
VQHGHVPNIATQSNIYNALFFPPPRFQYLSELASVKNVDLNSSQVKAIEAAKQVKIKVLTSQDRD